MIFLEAVKEFQARIDEKSIPLHNLHHEQVAKAVEIFNQLDNQIKASDKKINTSQGPNEKKAIAYLDGFIHIPEISEDEKDLIVKAKQAITTGKFQQLQRDINKLQSSTKNIAINPVLLLENLISIITQYPLENIGFKSSNSTIMIKSEKEYIPEIIISESFNV